jgi:hypothetical protein
VIAKKVRKTAMMRLRRSGPGIIRTKHGSLIFPFTCLMKYGAQTMLLSYWWDSVLAAAQLTHGSGIADNGPVVQITPPTSKR